MKFLLCRLDFNEFYLRKEEEARGNGSDNDGDDMEYDNEDDAIEVNEEGNGFDESEYG